MAEFGPNPTPIEPNTGLPDPSSAGGAGHESGAVPPPSPNNSLWPVEESQGVSLPQVGKYEILGELGRGGMGVVYKARHKELKRLVALKMILAGEYAGADQFARFQIEAEAIARLQHPNIVQIYEVGEQGSCPFLALELVDGGSLAAKSKGTALSPYRAAQFVEILARAVHAAHLQNIVHRDLKPANVLMTADGTPKVTDFGLAKRLDASTGPTASGAVMGTPSYMAPEQAAGKIKEIGPGVDIYGLGAILYELLTGHPPFKGESPLETIAQVQSKDPIPPSRFNRELPRDLERITLKCLEKAPSRRYPSALDLAQDLERFLAGKPVQAPPATAWRRLRKWAKRKPVVASLAVLCFGFGMPTLGGIMGHYGITSWQDYQQRHRLANAQEFIQTGDYTAAIGSLTQFIEGDPTNPQARFLRAKAFFREQKMDEAVADLITAAPEDPDGRMNAFLGFLIQLQHRPKKAIPYYRTAIAKGFAPAEVYNNLGYGCLRTANFREASACLDRAVELNPALSAGYYNRAYLRLMQGVTDLGVLSRALQDMETAITLGPQTATLYRHAASLYALAAEVDPVYTDRALVYLRKAVQKGTDPRELAADSYFTILRENPRFQKLIHGAPALPALPPEADLHLADLSKILFTR